MAARKLEQRIDHEAVLRLRLKQLRFRLQIDEREAAQIAGVSQRSWRKWESGTVKMQTYSFLKVGRAFNCSLDWLYGVNTLEVRS